MNKIKTENWNNYIIRFVEKDGEWWASAKDVSDAMGYAKTSNLTKKLKEKYKGTAKWSTPGGEQSVAVLSEQGIYKAIMNSHKPEAEDFEDWVFKVIKELREETGLEGFQIFRMLDKEHQKDAMSKLSRNLRQPVRRDFIKANTVANKAISTKYGYPKMIKKDEMTPEMLVDRQGILESAVELISVKDRYSLDLSVSEEVYKLVNDAANNLPA
ncbi:BRO family, N-terminal domain [Popillia japonica]|uniref:BRO family, N-terminal domain n=1 Tax=Popillia japonica TaxID=7064 RepID=A0AAW1HVY9_POPJA